MRNVRIQDIDQYLLWRAYYNLKYYASLSNRVDMALINDQLDELKKAITYLTRKQKQMKRRKKKP